MLVRGSLGKKLPYGKVSVGDRLFFATGNSSRNVVKAAASAGDVFDSPKLTGNRAGMPAGGPCRQAAAQ